MAVWEFFYLQDGGISESFTHKMAAWEICLQDGCVFESLEYILRLQCRIYLVNVTWLVVIIMSTGRHYSDYRSTVKRWTFNNAQRHVMTFRPISEAARSWSCDNQIWRTSVENVALGLRPCATFSTSGSSYLNVTLTTMHHLYSVLHNVYHVSANLHTCNCVTRV